MIWTFGATTFILLNRRLRVREMCRWCNAYTEHIYAVLRVVVGFLFACHGAQKWFGVLGGTVQIHTTKGLIAGTVELVGGILIALGLLTRVAAFISSGEMAVAYFWVHAKTSIWPILNKGDLPVVYCFLFLFIATKGGGRFSLDALLRRDSSQNRDT
jgi:putative oxidoreductase